VFLDLEQRFENADDITEDEVREWSRQLVTANRKARTINDVWLTAARTVFAWAEEERLITSNPFKDVRVTEPRRVKHRETDAFMSEEWRTILRAASAIGTPKTTFQGAQRWVPWLCAYSGARPGEITQLRGVDIRDRDHVTVMVLTPDAGTIKTSKVAAFRCLCSLSRFAVGLFQGRKGRRRLTIVALAKARRPDFVGAH
jgi:integrase